ncbi:MAG: LacI family DNA-binding transcriptional regulator [Bacteroidaceae bacterium]|nr:LacI family DNA-binding transcriptional regulator [Bacteroidaceae bacterium]
MSNKQEAKVFTFNENNKPIRVELVDGEPWFVAKDVCDALTLENSRKATASLDDDEKGVSPIVTPSGTQQMTIVNESGLYNLIFQSRKPEAKKFRKWVTGEVLPSIRKTGRYEASTVSQHTEQGVAVRPRRSRSELVNADLLNLLWLIGESLMQGEIRDVALELGVSRQTVSKVLNGYARNPRVLMALYNRAKANRACGMIYHRPDVMAERLIDAENGDVVVQLPSVVYGSRKKGGQVGNQNARKHWRKEGK